MDSRGDIPLPWIPPGPPRVTVLPHVSLRPAEAQEDGRGEYKEATQLHNARETHRWRWRLEASICAGGRLPAGGAVTAGQEVRDAAA